MLNIQDVSEPGLGVTLGFNVTHWHTALYWLEYYRRMYGAGVPFEDGRGVYKGVFVIVRQDEDTGVYHTIH